MRLLFLLIPVLLVGLSSGCGSKLDDGLCIALTEKANKCEMPLLREMVRGQCKEHLGEVVRDYEMFKKWSEMDCASLKTAFEEELARKPGEKSKK